MEDLIDTLGDIDPGDGNPPDGFEGPCFGFLEECNRRCPKDPGGCEVDYFVVQPRDRLIEDIGFWPFGKYPGRPTYNNVFGWPVRGYSQHGVGRVCCPQKDGTTKCMYFDIGSDTTEGNFGGDDFFFPPDDPDFNFDIDPDKTYPYFR